MATRDLDPLELSDDSSNADDRELARTLTAYLDGLASGTVKDLKDFLAQNPLLGRKIAFELETLEELGYIFDGRVSPPSAFGEFRVLKMIGRGGMGVVHEAWQTSLSRSVALKVLPPGFLSDSRAVERFHREAKVAASLHHPNIVEVYAMGVENGTPYFAMELVAGETLHQLEKRLQSTALKGNTPGRKSPAASPNSRFARKATLAPALYNLPTAALEAQDGERGSDPTQLVDGNIPDHLDANYCKWVAEIFVGAAEGLQHAHSNGIVHRDLKPANLILDTKGRLRILDFGLAWVKGQSSLTLTKQRPGTPPYMSPEQAEGRTDIFGPAIDIYSLGATMYEMLVWRPPFKGKSDPETFHLISTSDATPLRRLNRNVPRDLETIVMKCLLKDPRERYGSAEALARDLGLLVDGEPIEAKPMPMAVRLARRAWRNRRRIAEGIAALFCIGLLALLIVRPIKDAWKAEDDRLAGLIQNAAINLSVARASTSSRSLWLGVGEKDGASPWDRLPKPDDSGDGGSKGIYQMRADAFEAGPAAVPLEPETVRTAVSQLREVLVARPGDPISQYYLARAALIEDDSHRARDHLLLSLRADPGCIPSLCLHAAILEHEEDPAAAEALSALEKIAAIPGKEWAAALLLARRAELSQDWKASVEASDALRASWEEGKEPYTGADVEVLFGGGSPSSGLAKGTARSRTLVPASFYAPASPSPSSCRRGPIMPSARM